MLAAAIAQGVNDLNLLEIATRSRIPAVLYPRKTE